MVSFELAPTAKLYIIMVQLSSGKHYAVTFPIYSSLHLVSVSTKCLYITCPKNWSISNYKNTWEFSSLQIVYPMYPHFPRLEIEETYIAKEFVARPSVSWRRDGAGTAGSSAGSSSSKRTESVSSQGSDSGRSLRKLFKRT